MAMGRRSQERQDTLFIASRWAGEVAGASLLSKAQRRCWPRPDFDRWIEDRCRRYYATEEKRGQPSIPPGRLLPHALGRLLRGNRQPARHRLALCRQPEPAAVPGPSAARNRPPITRR